MLARCSDRLVQQHKTDFAGQLCHEVFLEACMGTQAHVSIVGVSPFGSFAPFVGAVGACG